MLIIPVSMVDTKILSHIFTIFSYQRKDFIVFDKYSAGHKWCDMNIKMK